MTLDAFGVLFSIAVFILLNRWGAGILHDPVYMAGLTTLGFLYAAISLFRSRWSLHVRIIMVLIIACVTTILPTISNFQNRQKSLAEAFINDSALQIEIAGRYILLGINPYSESYEQTDLAKWKYVDDAGNTINPALYNNVHPPLLLMVSALEYRIFSQLLGWSDIRVIYLFAYVSILILAWRKFGVTQQLLLFLVFVAANPLFTTFISQGTNDVVVLALLLWSLFMVERKGSSLLMAGGLLGLALATKQTAWVAAPFVFFRLMAIKPRRTVWPFIAGTITTALLCYLPFIVWNAGAMINSIVLYISTNTTTLTPIHPIEGIGFSAVLPALGIVKTIYSQYPFMIVQLSALIAVWIFYLFVKRHPATKNTSHELFFIAMATAVVWFFSKYFLQSHLGYIVTLFGCAYFWEAQTSKDKDIS